MFNPSVRQSVFSLLVRLTGFINPKMEIKKINMIFKSISNIKSIIIKMDLFQFALWMLKSKGFVSVCLYRRISLIAEPIWFSFTMYLIIDLW